MVLMVVCAVGTELDLHAHMVSKPLHENLQLRLGFTGKGSSRFYSERSHIQITG